MWFRRKRFHYSKEEEFFDTITRAKQKVEEYVEERLFDRDGVNGARFNLVNNFKNWSEKQEVDTTVSNRIEIINDLPSDVDED